jgi:biofilm PGA synthesis lipoprotein PgaB
VLSFATSEQDLLVQTWNLKEQKAAPDPKAYKRLSPFVTEVRTMVQEIYRELAMNANFDGLLFHDDALFSDLEDAHPAAMAWRREKSLTDDPQALWNSDDEMRRWARLKTEYLIEFTQDLTDVVKEYRPEIKTARNLYARVVLDSTGELRFSQNLELFLQHYDYTALMAMPYLEEADDAETWLRELVTAVDLLPGGLKKTIFELQSIDWNQPKTPLPTSTLVRHMRLLQGLGAVNFGYYPDDFLTDHPAAEQLHPAFSLNTMPFGN